MDTQGSKERADIPDYLENPVIRVLMDFLDTAEEAGIQVIPELKEYLAIVVTQVLKEYQDIRDWVILDTAVFQDLGVLMGHLVIAESKESPDTLDFLVSVGTQEYMVHLVIAELKEQVDIQESKEFRVILVLKAPLDILEGRD